MNLNKKSKALKSAFTMIELVFVIVILGIIAGIAIPKLAATRDDAQVSRIKTQINAIRSGIAIQKSQNLMTGNVNSAGNYYPEKLDDAAGGQESENLFWFGNGNPRNVLGTPIRGTNGDNNPYKWRKSSNSAVSLYAITLGSSTTVVQFRYDFTSGTFACENTTGDKGCEILGETVNSTS